MDFLLADVISQTFMTEVGKFQAKAEIPIAMKVRFKTQPDYNVEEGYRYLELVIYAPFNYVQVWFRTSWIVVPLEEKFVKSGKEAYQEGTSEWKCVADHDNCWRDGVRQILRENKLSTFDGLQRWFEVVDVASLQLPENTK